MEYKDIVSFFENDLKIKLLMLDMAPNNEDFSSKEASFNYGERFYNKLIEIEDILKDISKKIDLDFDIESFFGKIKDAFSVCNYDIYKIRDLYSKSISSMSEKLIKKVKDEFIGYMLHRDVEGVLEQINTVNELLHVYHNYIVNIESFYIGLPNIKQDGKILYKGEEMPIADDIYEAFIDDPMVNHAMIISMPKINKAIAMIRGRGHSTTLEATVADGIVRVNYFVPKNENTEMVNNLPGVRALTDDNTFNNGTNGYFEVNEDEFREYMTNFVQMIPSGEDNVYNRRIYNKNA